MEKRLKKPFAQVTGAELSTLLSPAQSQRKRGGKELVEKAKTDPEAAAESKRKARAGKSEAGQAASGAGCGKGSAQRDGGQGQGVLGKNDPRVWHTCSRECCGERFAKKPGTLMPRHFAGGCNGVCVGFKKGQICQGC